MSDSTGTPRVTFTRSTASNGLSSPPSGLAAVAEVPGENPAGRQTRLQLACPGSWFRPESTPTWRDSIRAPARRWNSPRSGGHGTRANPGLRFSGLRMDVHDGQVALTRSRIKIMEDKVMRTGNFAQGKIFRRRAHENHVVILDVVEGKQASALNANLPVQQPEGVVECMDRQHFPDAGIVFEDFIRESRAGSK